MAAVPTGTGRKGLLLPPLSLARALALGAAVAAVLLAGGPARADSRTSLPDPDYAYGGVVPQRNVYDRYIDAIVYPTLGFPSVCAWGETLAVDVRLQDGGVTTDWAIELSPTVAPATRTHHLPAPAVAWDAATGIYRLEAMIGPDVPRDTYDLRVVSSGLAGGEDRQPQAVRVLRDHPRRWRFVHICDAQLQDIRTLWPGAIPRMIEDIRLLDPDFVVYSGDLNFGQSYRSEYAENYAIYRQIGVATFFVPGNHDGYATIVPTSLLPFGDPPGYLLRDGLNHWRTSLGPTNYSFDIGNLHFAAVNTYDGEAKRRNSVGTWIVNWGGEVDAAQLAWLDQDLAAAAARGRDIVIFGHHDWHMGVHPNRDAYPFPFRLTASTSWNDAASATELSRLVARYPVTHVLIGHVHHDDYDAVVVNPGTPDERTVHFVTTTAVGPGLPPRLGYRVIEVVDDAITSWDYKPLGSGRSSWPIDFAPNFEVDFHDPNDGTASSVSLRVDSLVERATPISVDIWLADAPGGYRAAGAQIDQVAPADAGGAIVTVVCDLAPLGGADIVVEEDPSGNGARVGYPAPGSTVASTAPGSTTSPPPAPARGSHGSPGLGCAAAPAPSAAAGAMSLAPLALLIGALAARRLARRASRP